MKNLVKVGFALGALGVLWSSTASAQSTSESSTDRPQTETIRPNRPLLLAGGLVIAASYIPPVVVAATSPRSEDKFLYIPIAGPWLDLSDRGPCSGSCGHENVNKALLITTGVAHIVGTGLVLASLFVPERRETTSAQASTKPLIVPARVGDSGNGVAVVGRF